MANMYYGKEKPGQATSRLRQAAELAETKEDKHKIFHNMGNSFMEQKKYDEAVEAYKQACAIILRTKRPGIILPWPSKSRKKKIKKVAAAMMIRKVKIRINRSRTRTREMRETRNRSRTATRGKTRKTREETVMRTSRSPKNRMTRGNPGTRSKMKKDSRNNHSPDNSPHNKLRACWTQ
jgi:hypothetical protein